MANIVNIFDIIDNYDILLFDIWGVLMEQKPYVEVIQAMQKIKEMKDVYIVTNMGRTRNTVRNKLLEQGLDIELHKIFTAGEAAISMLKNKRANKENLTIYHFDDSSSEANIYKELLQGTDINVTKNMDEANLLIISQFADNINESTKFDAELEMAASKKIEAICSNPDTIVVNEGNTRYCAGFFAEKYKNFGGVVHYAGKPYMNIYDEVFSTIKDINKIDKNRILMIGDTLETDILGAKNANIHSALVATGNMQKILLNKNLANHEKYNLLIKNAEIEELLPNWIIEIK